MGTDEIKKKQTRHRLFSVFLRKRAVIIKGVLCNILVNGAIYSLHNYQCPHFMVLCYCPSNLCLMAICLEILEYCVSLTV